MVYKSWGGAWVKFQMRENHPKYINRVLNKLRITHPIKRKSVNRSKGAAKYHSKYVGPRGGVYILRGGVKRYI